MMEYKVVCLGNLVQLTELIADDIEKGWKPQGGITGTPDPRGTDKDGVLERRFGTLWAQAMVRKAVPKIPKRFRCERSPAVAIS